MVGINIESILQSILKNDILDKMTLSKEQINSIERSERHFRDYLHYWQRKRGELYCQLHEVDGHIQTAVDELAKLQALRPIELRIHNDKFIKT